jgi:hypothetical protein
VLVDDLSSQVKAFLDLLRAATHWSVLLLWIVNGHSLRHHPIVWDVKVFSDHLKIVMMLNLFMIDPAG